MRFEFGILFRFYALGMANGYNLAMREAKEILAEEKHKNYLKLEKKFQRMLALKKEKK